MRHSSVNYPANRLSPGTMAPLPFTAFKSSTGQNYLRVESTGFTWPAPQPVVRPAEEVVEVFAPIVVPRELTRETLEDNRSPMYAWAHDSQEGRKQPLRLLE